MEAFARRTDVRLEPGNSLGPARGAPSSSAADGARDWLVTGRRNPRRLFSSCLLGLAVGVLLANLAAAPAAEIPAGRPEESIRSGRWFQEPLVPDRTPTVEESEALLGSLRRVASRVDQDDLSELTRHVAQWADGAWTPSVKNQLGLEWYRLGYFSRALEAWESVWRLRAAAAGGTGAAAIHAGTHLAEMYARLGRMEALIQLLPDLESRCHDPADLQRAQAARAGLEIMQARPEVAFRCGPLALDRIRSYRAPTNACHPLIFQSRSTTNGLSLGEVADLATALEMKYQMAFRSNGAPVLTPSVVHWRAGHFAAVVARRGERFLTQDPTFWNESTISKEALESEASGYFLVPGGSLPQGWRAVGTSEGSRIFGKGTTKSSDPDSTTPWDAKARNRPGPRSAWNDQPNNCGLASWDLHLLLLSQQITDTPIGYSPPVGPPVFVTFTYNQRQNYRFGFRSEWVTGWEDSIVDEPRNPFANLYLSIEGGWLTFKPDNDSTNEFVALHRNLGRLARTSTNSYEWLFPDGTKRLYSSGASTNAVNLRSLLLSGIEDSAGNRVTIQRNAAGRAESLTDAIGQVTRLFYELTDPGFPSQPDPFSPNVANRDFSNQPTRVVDPFGRVARLNYIKTTVDVPGSAGPAYRYFVYQLASITDVVGLTSRFAYEGWGGVVTNLATPYGETKFRWQLIKSDPRGFFIEITDAEGATERYEFNESSRIQINRTERLDAVPRRMNTVNDWLYGRNVYHWDKKSFAEAFSPTDYRSATIYHFQHAENLTVAGPILESLKRPLEHRVWFNYPGQGAAWFPGTSDQPSRIGRVLDDGTTQLWQAEYNDLGNVTRSTDPLGREITLDYAANGIDVIAARQTRGGQNEVLARATYNARHQPLTVTDAAGQTTRFAYNARGQVIEAGNPRNDTTRFGYDANGYLVEVDGPLPGPQDRSAFTYDAAGRIRTAVDQDNYTLTFDYDALDRMTRVTFPDGTSQQTTYQRLNIATVRDRLGREVRLNYDGLGRVVSTEDALGRITRFQWCGCGDVSSVIDPLGRMTQWHRDLQGRVIGKEYADGSKIRYDYEKTTSRLSRIVDEQNQITQYRYDLAGSLVEKRHINSIRPTPDVAYAYDLNYRRVISMTDGNGLTMNTYRPIDGLPGAGRLALVDGPWANDEAAYAYDELGRVRARTIHGVGMRKSYDAAGRLSQLTNALGAFRYAWEGGSDRLSAVDYPNGQRTAYAYYGNAGDQLPQKIKHLLPGGATLSEFSYDYNSASQITKWTQFQASRLKAWSPSYDATDRLTNIVETVSGGASSLLAWSHDAADNRFLELLNGERREFNHNALNQLTDFTPNLPIPSAACEWDAENRLIVISNATSRVEMSYDGYGRRTRIVERNGNGLVRDRRFLWCGLQLAEERDASGANTLKRFSSFGVQNVASPDLPPGDYFLTRDHLGSIREMTSGLGTASVFDYTAFGESRTLSGSMTSDFGFAGYFQQISTGTLLAPFRAYQPSLGRWLSRDPGAERAGLNLYAYADQDPVNRVDPDGWDSAAAPLLQNTPGYKAVKNAQAQYDAVKKVGQALDSVVEKGVRKAATGAVDGKLRDEAKKAIPKGARDEAAKLNEAAGKRGDDSIDPYAKKGVSVLGNGINDALGGDIGAPRKGNPLKRKCAPAKPEKSYFSEVWDSWFGAGDAPPPPPPDGPINVKPAFEGARADDAY